MEKLALLLDSLPIILGIVAICVGGWMFNTWLRIKEAIERIKLLTSENAQLRAELGSVKDRLETIERIVTDQPMRLAKEIDQLAIGKGGRA
jgi:Tfp pilus assembly protein PilN